jgi:putative ABC transport system ATP-binding protein
METQMETAPAPILSIQALTKHYLMGEVTVEALRGASFEVNQGEFVVILGPSGSGKTTMLNILGGMDQATSGTVTFRGKVLNDFTEKGLTEYRRNVVGFVFQFYNLLGNLTARENVELATEIIEDHLDVDEVMNDVGLTDRADHFPAQMSGGEQQRVAIARAVCKNPDLLLCDEPTGALDYETGIQILKLLKKINIKYKKTVIIITHNASIAIIADRVLRMRSGEIVENTVNPAPMDPEKVTW